MNAKCYNCTANGVGDYDEKCWLDENKPEKCWIDNKPLRKEDCQFWEIVEEKEEIK